MEFVWKTTHRKNSITKTTMQAAKETWNRLFSLYARMAAAKRAAIPDHMLLVAVRMAGKVITDNVT